MISNTRTSLTASLSPITHSVNSSLGEYREPQLDNLTATTRASPQLKVSFVLAISTIGPIKPSSTITCFEEQHTTGGALYGHPENMSQRPRIILILCLY